MRVLEAAGFGSYKNVAFESCEIRIHGSGCGLPVWGLRLSGFSLNPKP